jgi:hypothetical protein
VKGKFHVIRTNGSVTSLDIDTAPELKMIQDAVGGYIELIPYFEKFRGENCVAYCNEEGKIRSMPMNTMAQGYWGHNFDLLVGDVAIITGDNELLESL